MKKSKKMALVMLAVMLMAVCFVFGVSAAEPTFEDYVNAGVIKSSYQTIIRIRLNGCMVNQPTKVYDFESGTFVNKSESEITDYYDIVPQTRSEMQPYEKVALPYLTIPADLYSDGWYCVNTDSYLEGRTYEITYDDCGKIVEIVAANQPQYTEGNFSYIVTDGKAEIVKARGFEDGRVVIPDTLGGYEVKNIRAYAFNDVYEEFYVSEHNNYFSVDESGALFNKDKTKIFAYPSLNPQTSYEVPDSVEIIGTCAFVRALYLKNLELPENLRIIEEQGIRSCWFALDEIHLSDKVEKLEEAAIYDMPFLKKIYIEGYDTELIGERVVGFIEMYFTDEADKDYCADLYARYAQGDEEALYELANYMEQPAESYYKATIYSHWNSTSGDYAEKNGIPFEGTHFYNEWYRECYIYRYRQCIYCGNIYEEWYETFTEGYYTYTVVDNEAAIIGVSPELEGDVVLPSTIGGYPLVAVDGAFFENETVTSVIIPDGVRYIGNGTFEECRKKLKKVVMPDTVTYLGTGAFMECYHLEEVVLSKNIKVIEPYTFEMCYSLKELNFPDGLERVESISMTGCASLKELIFPESVVRIEGYSMMASSLSVEKIVIGSKAKDAGDNNTATFGELVSLKDFYVYSPDYDPEDSGLGYVSIAPKDMPKDEWIALYVEAVRELDHHHNTSEKLENVMNHTEVFEPRISDILTIHAVHDSKTEIYAKENGIKFEYIHDFEGAKWTYDYENMVRYRDCMYPGCDGREIEELKKTETDNGETVAPDQDGDFNIDEILGDDFLVIEEHIKENVSGDVEVEVLKGFDITLTNQDGVHIQPDGIVKVKLPLDWSKKGIYKVYHVGENGVLTDMNAYREGSHLVFDTDHFSIYVIVFVPDETTEPEPEAPDTPAEPDTESCDCICHATGFLNRILAFVYKLILKLFAMAPLCECGVAHY